MEPLASADPKGREGQRASSGYHSCYAVDPVMKGHEDGGNMFFGMEEALPIAEAKGAFRRYP
jgi:hypothetical protein